MILGQNSKVLLAPLNTLGESKKVVLEKY